MMRKTMFCLALLLSSQVLATERFVTFEKTGDSQLCLTQMTDTVVYDPLDWEGVKMAVENLRRDLTAVTGSPNAPIEVGTVRRSRIASEHRRLAKPLEGKWEQYIITTDKNKLVILGSDKRGTIYGIYELSRQMGVSPWYWWADAPIPKHDHLYVRKGLFTDGEPAVKYRGIFINDEWPSFGEWATNHFGGLNSQMYARLFELLLRLKANYFWPAMWNSRFNEDDPLSPVIADRMGIVMGTSHHEPMMRAHKEYVVRKNEVGPWDYATNPQRIERFFKEGIERNKGYENIITIGMRGDGDVAMGSGDDQENMRILADVIKAQRDIISKCYGRPAEDVPQVWAIFTEVQRYYDAGFTVPDDVTLLLCDNNWGYIRRKGREDEQKRKGGLGLYYHIDMNGGPWNDRWINTSPIPKLREQLHLAYESGIDRIWIVNVGDLKPKEVPIDFIMDYAWNPNAVGPGDEQAWLEHFAEEIFGQRHAAEIADLIARYAKYNLWRKPETQVPGLFNQEEMRLTDSLWTELENRAEKLKTAIPPEAQHAFFQLVYYPVVASAGVAKIYNCATRGESEKIERLLRKDSLLSVYYNDKLADGKWNGMMQDRHVGYTKWSMPKNNANPMTLFKERDYDYTKDGTASGQVIPAYRFLRNVPSGQTRWILLPDLGRGKGCMGIEDVMAPSDTLGTGPALEYDVEVDNEALTVAIGILPTQDILPERGLRLGVQLDDGPMRTLDARRGLVDTFGEYTPKNLAVSKRLKALPSPSRMLLSGWRAGQQMRMRNEVFDNLRWLDASFETSPGRHTLRVIMVDPEVVVEQLVINPDNSHYSYGL